MYLSMQKQQKKSLQRSIARRQLNFQEKPLKGVKFYLDVKTEDIKRRVLIRLRDLGGHIEEFLSKDVDTLITDAQQKSHQHQNSNSSTGISSQPTCLPSAALSRGKALLLKATQQSYCSPVVLDVVQNALNLGVKVQQVKDFFKSTQKLVQRLCKDSPQSMPEEVMEGVSPLKWQHHKVDNRVVLKFEDATQTYRPVMRHLERMPEVRYDEGLISPFDKGVILCRNADKNSNRYSVKKKVSGGVSKGGFCEACDYWYKCTLREHLNSEKHQKFIRNSSNYENLNLIVNKLPNIEDFVSRYVPTIYSTCTLPKSDSGFGDASSEFDFQRHNTLVDREKLHFEHMNDSKNKVKKAATVFCKENSKTGPISAADEIEMKTDSSGGSLCIYTTKICDFDSSSKKLERKVLSNLTNKALDTQYFNKLPCKTNKDLQGTFKNGSEMVSGKGNRKGVSEASQSSKSSFDLNQYQMYSPVTSPKSQKTKDTHFSSLARKWLNDISVKESCNNIASSLKGSVESEDVKFKPTQSSLNSFNIEQCINNLSKRLIDFSEEDKVINFSAMQEECASQRGSGDADHKITTRSTSSNISETSNGNADRTQVNSESFSSKKRKKKQQERIKYRKKNALLLKEVESSSAKVTDADVSKCSSRSQNDSCISLRCNSQFSAESIHNTLLQNKQINKCSLSQNGVLSPAVESSQSFFTCSPLSGLNPSGSLMPVFPQAQPNSPRHSVEQFYQGLSQWQGIQLQNMRNGALSSGKEEHGMYSQWLGHKNAHSTQNLIFSNPNLGSGQHPFMHLYHRTGVPTYLSSPGHFNISTYYPSSPSSYHMTNTTNGINKDEPQSQPNCLQHQVTLGVDNVLISAQRNEDALNGNRKENHYSSPSLQDRFCSNENKLHVYHDTTVVDRLSNSMVSNASDLSRAASPHSNLNQDSSQHGFGSEMSENAWNFAKPNQQAGLSKDHTSSSHLYNISDESTDSYDYNSLHGMFLRQNQQYQESTSLTPTNALSCSQDQLDETLTPKYLDISYNTKEIKDIPKSKCEDVEAKSISFVGKITHSVSHILSNDTSKHIKNEHLKNSDNSEVSSPAITFSGHTKCEVTNDISVSATSITVDQQKSNNAISLLVNHEFDENIPLKKDNFTKCSQEIKTEEDLDVKVPNGRSENAKESKDHEPLLMDDLLKDTPTDRKKKRKNKDKNKHLENESKGRGKKRKYADDEDCMQYIVQPLSATKIRLCRVLMTPVEEKSSLTDYWKVQKSVTKNSCTPNIRKNVSGEKEDIFNDNSRCSKQQDGGNVQPNKRKRRCMLDFSDKWIASFVF